MQLAKHNRDWDEPVPPEGGDWSSRLHAWKPWLHLLRIVVECIGIIVALSLMHELIQKATDLSVVEKEIFELRQIRSYYPTLINMTTKMDQLTKRGEDLEQRLNGFEGISDQVSALSTQVARRLSGCSVRIVEVQQPACGLANTNQMRFDSASAASVVNNPQAPSWSCTEKVYGLVARDVAARTGKACDNAYSICVQCY